jgi:hypothetical protein
LPVESVAVTEEGNKILVDKHPSPTGLGRGQDAALSAGADLLRMHLEEGSGFV